MNISFNLFLCFVLVFRCGLKSGLYAFYYYDLNKINQNKNITPIKF